MIAELKPYSEYKDSGLPWLGQVPGHWQTERAKWLFTKMDRPVRDDDEVVTCFRDGMVTLRKNRRLRGFTEATVYSGYQGIRKGDLVIHGMDAFAGAIGVSDSDGKGTPVYNVCQPRPGVNAHYYANLVREMSQSQWILALAKGIRERSTDFRFEMFGNQRVPLPPPEEQAAIVRFLDWANGRLDRTIRAKRKVIALLNEQKQAIIHRAVTRGLDPNVPLKPSGIPWLGDIPAHWVAIPIKRLLSHLDYGTSEASIESGSIRILTMGSIQKGEVLVPRSGGLNSLPDSLLLQHHDLLFTRTNGNPNLVGKVGIFRGELSDKVSFASYLVRLRVKEPHCPQLLHLILNSSAFWPFARSHALVNLQTNLNSTRYSQFQVPVPPPAEQSQIVEVVGEESKTFNIAISRLEREIELLREYRTRLVADVVTGKLDVRAAAAQLPEEALPDPAEVEEVEYSEEGDAEPEELEV